MAGLPDSSAWVWLWPPLSCKGPSIGSMPIRLWLALTGGSPPADPASPTRLEEEAESTTPSMSEAVVPVPRRFRATIVFWSRISGDDV